MSLLGCAGVPHEGLLLVRLGSDTVGETVSGVVLAQDVAVLRTLVEPLERQFVVPVGSDSLEVGVCHMVLGLSESVLGEDLVHFEGLGGILLGSPSLGVCLCHGELGLHVVVLGCAVEPVECDLLVLLDTVSECVGGSDVVACHGVAVCGGLPVVVQCRLGILLESGTVGQVVTGDQLGVSVAQVSGLPEP